MIKGCRVGRVSDSVTRHICYGADDIGYEYSKSVSRRADSLRALTGRDSNRPHIRKLENNRTKKPHEEASKCGLVYRSVCG